MTGDRHRWRVRSHLLPERECAAVCAQRLIPRLRGCRQTPLLLSRTSGRPCAGLWLIANAFYWCLERHRNAPAHNYHTRERHDRILTLFRAAFLSFLAGAYLSLIDANSDPLLRTLLLLLLGHFVSSSETSHLSYSPGAEEKQAQRSPKPPGAQVHGCPTRFMTVGDGEGRRTFQRVSWMWLLFVLGWRVDAPDAFA